jgi:hypothetical protein
VMKLGPVVRVLAAPRSDASYCMGNAPFTRSSAQLTADAATLVSGRSMRLAKTATCQSEAHGG